MSSLSISRQIYLAVGCALALLAALASLSYLATTQLATIFDGYKATAHQTLAADELLQDVFDAQFAAFRYRLNPSEHQAEAVWKQIEKMADEQMATRKTLAGDDVVLGKLLEISRSIEGYRDAFAQMTELKAKSDRIVADLSEIGPQVREKLTSIMDFAYENGDTWVGYDVGIAQQELMRGRFYHERYLLTSDPNTFARALGFLMKAKSQIESLYARLYDPAMQRLALEATDQISAYIDSAEQNRYVIIARNDVRDRELDALSPYMRGQLKELVHSAVDRQRMLGSSGTETAETTLFLAVFLSIGALIIGGALGVIVARHISGSVRDMADTMSELAEGNLDVTVKGTEQEHELGMMARAMEVFKVNAQHLQRSLDKERELSGLQRQFVSMVSHEFRTPLAIIDGNAQRLQRRPEKITADRVLKVVKTIRTSVMRLTDLMESVLSAARMEGGQIKFEPNPFDIGKMIGEVCRSYADINSRHTIEVDLQMLPETYDGDAKLLHQVVSNLVSNAIKYSPDDTTVHVRGYLMEDDGILISVKDEGVGIPNEELHKLFERFFRASTSTGIPGSGIGLHLAQQLVALHDGTVHVQSAIGKGTVFEIRLPARKEASITIARACEDEASNAIHEHQPA